MLHFKLRRDAGNHNALPMGDGFVSENKWISIAIAL